MGTNAPVVKEITIPIQEPVRTSPTPIKVPVKEPVKVGTR